MNRDNADLPPEFFTQLQGEVPVNQLVEGEDYSDESRRRFWERRWDRGSKEEEIYMR